MENKGRQKIDISRQVLLKDTGCHSCGTPQQRGMVAFLWHIQGQITSSLLCTLCIAAQLSAEGVEISVPGEP